MSGLVLPDYEGACLSNLLSGVVAQLLGETSVLDIPRAARYVILLIDGLGWYPVAAHSHDSDLFAPRLGEATRLTCAVPSTTATSLTSIGCGSEPGRHGVVGYSFLDPDRGCVVNALTWAGGPVDVEGFACESTLYQRIRSRGLTGGCVSLARFKGSGLQKLAFGGSEHLGVETEGDHRAFIGLVIRACATTRWSTPMSVVSTTPGTPTGWAVGNGWTPCPGRGPRHGPAGSAPGRHVSARHGGSWHDQRPHGTPDHARGSSWRHGRLAGGR